MSDFEIMHTLMMGVQTLCMMLIAYIDHTKR